MKIKKQIKELDHDAFFCRYVIRESAENMLETIDPFEKIASFQLINKHLEHLE